MGRIPTFASSFDCVYDSILTKCRLVEATISAPGLGTESGESQWCNRLPEVCDDLGGRFCVLWEEGHPYGDQKAVVEPICGIP